MLVLLCSGPVFRESCRWSQPEKATCMMGWWFRSYCLIAFVCSVLFCSVLFCSTWILFYSLSFIAVRTSTNLFTCFHYLYLLSTPYLHCCTDPRLRHCDLRGRPHPWSEWMDRYPPSHRTHGAYQILPHDHHRYSRYGLWIIRRSWNATCISGGYGRKLHFQTYEAECTLSTCH